MKNLTLSDFRKLPGTEFINFESRKIYKKSLRGVSIDSRSLKGNQVFWALKGPKYDGHDFVIEAIKKGAVAAVINKRYVNRVSGMGIPLIAVKDSLEALQSLAAIYRKKFRIPLLAITGTNGKTTTKEMIAWILQTRMSVHHTWGNLNNHIGVPLTLLTLNSEHEISIVELGTNHPGEIAMLSQMTQPTAALITNIGRGHLEFFSSIEGVAREKLELFKSLGNRGIIFLNKDDPHLPDIPGRKNTLWSYSLDQQKNVRVTGIINSLNEDGCGIWTLNNRVSILMQVPGLHNVRNALAASAVALYFGCTEKEIKHALESYTAYDKRMQIIKNGTITIINDSYNANPDSYLPALETLEHMARKQNARKIVVFGDMLELGLKSEAYHQELMFNILDFDISAVFTLGKSAKIAAELLRERGVKRIYSFDSHQALANKLVEFLQPKDIILLKGSRGMQMEKVLAYM
jgi:UDP-N-acetylmuramoyl-tripeptide--D-alanyl-D-alanine ligase